jgi:hypothetical protein
MSLDDSARVELRKSRHFSMRRQWLTTGLFLLGIVLSVYLAVTHPREPTYAGKTVNQWLDAGFEDASMALHEIGPPSLPFILARLNRETTRQGFWSNYERARKQVPHCVGRFLPKRSTSNFDEERACGLTLELGPKVIPVLAHDLQNSNSKVRELGAHVLAVWHDRGKDIQVASPFLIRAMQDSSPDVRKWATHALGADIESVSIASSRLIPLPHE